MDELNIKANLCITRDKFRSNLIAFIFKFYTCIATKRKRGGEKAIKICYKQFKKTYRENNELIINSNEMIFKEETKR